MAAAVILWSPVIITGRMPAWIHSAKDNDLLLAMPIPTSMILLIRLSGIYAMGLLYELIVMIPMVLIWFGNAPFLSRERSMCC